MTGAVSACIIACEEKKKIIDNDIIAGKLHNFLNPDKHTEGAAYCLKDISR